MMSSGNPLIDLLSCQVAPMGPDPAYPADVLSSLTEETRSDITNSRPHAKIFLSMCSLLADRGTYQSVIDANQRVAGLVGSAETMDSEAFKALQEASAAAVAEVCQLAHDNADGSLTANGVDQVLEIAEQTELYFESLTSAGAGRDLERPTFEDMGLSEQGEVPEEEFSDDCLLSAICDAIRDTTECTLRDRDDAWQAFLKECKTMRVPTTVRVLRSWSRLKKAGSGAPEHANWAINVANELRDSTEYASWLIKRIADCDRREGLISRNEYRRITRMIRNTHQYSMALWDAGRASVEQQTSVRYTN